MKRLLPFFLAISFTGCEKVVEENLYNKYDKDWDLVQDLIANQCRNESKIFQELKKRGSFSTYYDNDTYYEIEIDKKNSDGSGGSNYKAYVKLDDVTSSTMTIHYYDSLDPSDSRSISFSTGEHDNLITAISNGVCATDDDVEFSHSSLDSSTKLSFTDSRLDGNDDDYTKHIDEYTADVSYPLPLTLFARTLKVTTRADGGSESDPAISTWKIDEKTESECQEISICNNATWNYTSGSFVIDPNAYLDNSTDSLILELN